MNELFDELERLIRGNIDRSQEENDEIQSESNRTFRWCIRLRKTEFERLQEVSQKLKISKSDLGRNLLFYKTRIPKMSQEQRQLLIEIANLKTSFSRISNYMKYDLDIKLKSEIEVVIQKVHEIYKQQSP